MSYIDEADVNNMAMIFTGKRHFKHEVLASFLENPERVGPVFFCSI